MNRIAKVINTMTGDKFKFVPGNEFYKSVSIGRKRWAQLLRHLYNLGMTPDHSKVLPQLRSSHQHIR